MKACGVMIGKNGFDKIGNRMRKEVRRDVAHPYASAHCQWPTIAVYARECHKDKGK